MGFATDIYVKAISFSIVDTNAVLSKFGNIAALSNGVEFTWVTDSNGSITLHEGLKTNFDFIRLAHGNPPFGDGATAFRASNVSGTSEGYIPVLDTALTYGLQWGLRLRASTNDKIVFKARDDVSSIDVFNIVATGILVAQT